MNITIKPTTMWEYSVGSLFSILMFSKSKRMVLGVGAEISRQKKQLMIQLSIFEAFFRYMDLKEHHVSIYIYTVL